MISTSQGDECRVSSVKEQPRCHGIAALVFTLQDVVLQQLMEISIGRRRGDNFRRVTRIVTFGLDSPGNRV